MYNFMNPMDGFRNNEKDFKIKVWGEGNVTAKADEAIISLGVVTKDKNIKKAKVENAVLLNKIIEGLIKIGIDEEDIETATYTITPIYDYQNNEKIFRGYEVKHILEISVKDINKADDVIDVATKNGANVINYIRFTVSNPELYYNQALEKAVLNSKEKAAVIAQTLGVEINEIPLRVTENPVDKGVPYYEMSKMAAMDTTTPIQLGSVQFKSRVSSVFGY
ncbi:oxidative stress defense protein [Clostridium sediminicola]|uniref:SIMPL domain-containing protein n=1 Tax=Clostridium sediminicola TaxID=3114879 RepID=UPI0031F1E332